mgnify:FL=1
MRGVKYNLLFTLQSDEKIKFSNLLILDLMETIESNINKEYNLKMKVTRDMIYNLVHRPLKSNKFVREFCKVSFTDRQVKKTLEKNKDENKEENKEVKPVNKDENKEVKPVNKDENKEENKELYKPFVSKAKNKKFSVYVMKDGKKRLIHYGDTRFEDYTQQNPKDEKRRSAYLARAKGIKNKKGELTWKLKDSPNYWSVRTLWNG